MTVFDKLIKHKSSFVKLSCVMALISLETGCIVYSAMAGIWKDFKDKDVRKKKKLLKLKF